MQSCLVLFIIIYLCVSPCPQYPNTTKVKNLVDEPEMTFAFKVLDALLQNASNTLSSHSGLMTVVVYYDEIIYSQGYGRINFQDKFSPVPNLDTVVEIASITKTFTSLLAFLLESQGVLEDGLDTTLSSLIEDFDIQSVYDQASEITLRELTSHTSGLPREIPCVPPDRDCTAETKPNQFEETQIRVLAALSTQYILNRRLARPRYSNLAFSLLGRALESALNLPYEQLLPYMILSPLNMTSSAFEIDDNLAKNLAIGIGRSGNAAIPINHSWSSPCGGLKSSSRDIAKYMSMILRLMNAKPNLKKKDAPFNPTMINAWTRQLSSCHDGQTAYGFPWEFYYNDKTNAWLMGKDGELDGYCSTVMMVPDLRLGVFTVAMDTTKTGPCTVKTETHVWTIPALEALGTALQKVLLRKQPLLPLPSGYKQLLGKYSAPDGVVIQVYVADSVYLMGDISVPPVKAIAHNLTIITDNNLDVFRASRTNQNLFDCRELTDGSNGELMYFGHSYESPSNTTKSGVTPMDNIYFMSRYFTREPD